MTINVTIVRRDATTVTMQAESWEAAIQKVAELDMRFYRLHASDLVFMAADEGPNTVMERHLLREVQADWRRLQLRPLDVRD